MSFAVLIAAAFAPANALRLVAPSDLTIARDRWLRVVLFVVVLALAPHEIWLAFVGLWFLMHWTSSALLSSLVTWLGIGASWALLLMLSPSLWAWLPSAWLAIAVVQVLVMTYRAWTGVVLGVVDPLKPRRWRGFLVRQTGTFGSPVLVALFLALVSPFCPWWLWPVLTFGLWLSFSWHALLGVAVGMLWQWPAAGPYVLAALVVSVFTWIVRPVREVVLERTPRGNNYDAFVSRWQTIRLIWHHARVEGHWLLGAGPYTMERALQRWGTCYRLELVRGEAHMELAQLYYEMGLLGVLAALAFAWRVGVHLTVGDPWSAAFVTALVLTTAHWPLRHPSLGLIILAIAAHVVQGGR